MEFRFCLVDNRKYSFHPSSSSIAKTFLTHWLSLWSTASCTSLSAHGDSFTAFELYLSYLLYLIILNKSIFSPQETRFFYLPWLYMSLLEIFFIAAFGSFILYRYYYNVFVNLFVLIYLLICHISPRVGHCLLQLSFGLLQCITFTSIGWWFRSIITSKESKNQYLSLSKDHGLE